MGKLPLENEIVDLSLSRHTNENRIITIGVLMELDGYSLPDRASVMGYALTASQQKDFDEYRSYLLDQLRNPDSLISSAHKHFESTTYVVDRKTLFIKGRPYDFSSSFKTQGLLQVMFSDRDQLTHPMAYLDFLDENSVSLQRYDITTPVQIRRLRSSIGAKVSSNFPDFFPDKGFLTINKKYL